MSCPPNETDAAPAGRSVESALDAHPLFMNTAPELRLQVSKRLAYSAQYNFCYFRVPKAANSTIALTLARHTGIDIPEDAPEDGARVAKRAFMTLPDLETVDRAFKFTFVRNPYSRILSAYLDKATRKSWAKRYGFKHRFLKKRRFTFLDFLRRLEDGALLANIHWAPQTMIIPYDLDRLDKIGRVENLDEDLACVVECIFHSPPEIRTRNDRRTGADRQVREYYGRREKALLQRLYAEDLERLYPEL